MKIERIEGKKVLADDPEVHFAFEGTVRDMKEFYALAVLLDTAASEGIVETPPVLSRETAVAATPNPDPKKTKKKTAPKPVRVASRIGAVDIVETANGFTAIAQDKPHAPLQAGGDTKEEALSNLLAIAAAEEKPDEPEPDKPARPVRTKVAPPKPETVKKDPPPPPADPKPDPPADAATSDAEGSSDAPEIPADLATATSFRRVMEWMLAHGFTDQSAIVAECTRLRPHVPAIGRLKEDTLSERIARALNVLAIAG